MSAAAQREYDVNDILIYETEDKQVEVQLAQETVWLNRHQLAELFDRDIKTIGKHINNVFRKGELVKDSTVAKFATVQTEGDQTFLFMDFLHRNGRLFNEDGEAIINDTGLAALTLLVAESDLKQKETLIRLIMNLLDSDDMRGTG
jgi:hypothetical protein